MSVENKNNFTRESIERLSEKDVIEILKNINDKRLNANEDIEHFTIHLSNGVRYVPKRKYILVENRNVPIEEFLMETLQKLDLEVE